jgi:hypothetical protein
VNENSEKFRRLARLGITPVGLGCLGFFVMIGAAMAGTWLVNLIMMFFPWLGL